MAATLDLISRINCFKKLFGGNIDNFDWFEPNTINNPVVRKGRVGSSPTAATIL